MLIYMVFLFFFTAIVVILMWKISKEKKDTSKYLQNIPGSPPTFLFGNMLDFAAGSKVYLPTFAKYLKTYGDTCVIHDGTFSWIILTVDYDFVEHIYSSTVLIEKAMQYSFFSGWLGEGLLTSGGTKWKSFRKAITPSFHFSILQQYIEIFESIGNNLVAKLTAEEGRSSVDISKIISLYTLDVICEAAMGTKVNALDGEESDYIKNIKEMCNIVISRSFSPLSWKLYPFTWTYYKEQRALKVIHKYVESVIRERIKKNEELKNKNNSDAGETRKRLAFLDLLLETRVNGRALTTKEIRDEVNTFMFEGHDTTSSAISFCLYRLANHPEVQYKVIAEQHAIFGDDLKNAIPTFSQLNEMKYLELVIKETLRLYPSVPFFVRQVTEEMEYKGSVYPKGMPLIIAPYIMHRDERYFPEPEKFKPERFEGKSRRLPYAYTPFSAGSRNCIGQKFAMLEMLSAVSKLVRHYELCPASPRHDLTLACEVVLISKNGVNISLKNRITS